jgi:hypothetical protein
MHFIRMCFLTLYYDVLTKNVGVYGYLLFLFSSEKSSPDQELKNHLSNLKCSISGQPNISIDK